MSHDAVLSLLFPLELGGAFPADLALEGAQLDAAQVRAEALLLEMFADSTDDLLSQWERTYGLIPGVDDPLQLRRNRLLRKIRELGDIKIPYFETLAAELGYSVTIDYDVPLMTGWAECGDMLLIEDAPHIWNVTVAGQPEYVARAGDSRAGERLLWWPTFAELETLLNDLKPAHKYLHFIYP